ncbi:unnamed protein product [Ectocarpus sp. 12 AP-2014]
MAPSETTERDEVSDEDLDEKDPFRELGAAQDTYPLANAPCLLVGFRWDTSTTNAVCDLDAVMVFFDDDAKSLALVDCVQDTYSNVAALIDDSVYNMEGGLEEDLEKMMLDLTRVDPKVSTIVAGVRSLSMTFQAHAVSSIKCVCASLRFRRFSNEGGAVDLTPAWHQRVVSSTRIFGVQHDTHHDQQALPQMKNKFFAEGHSRGLRRHPFVHAVFMHLYQTTKGLHVKADAARVVAMLDELFDQIDINGNDYVDWEEFTSFCIELGVISGKGTNNAAFQPDDFIIEYQPVSLPGVAGCGGGSGCVGGGNDGGEDEATVRSGSMIRSAESGHGPGVAFMTYVPELKQAYYADKGSNILKALDSIGKPNHQHEFLDPYFVEGQHVAVHTVAYIPGRYLVVFCSDHSVNLMKEVKNRRGCTHGYHSEAKVMHQLMHRKLMWEPCFQKLISVGSDNHLYEWEASTPAFFGIWIVDEIAVGAKRIHLHPEHCNTITDIVCIAEKELVVTSSLDRRVCVWQIPTWKLRAMFRDHTLGVQALSYLRGTLLSAGFDWEIIAWDADRLEKIGTMNGHKAPVTAVAQMVCPTNYEDMKAVSADCNHEIRVWDLSGCIAGGNTIPCLMVFRLPHFPGAVQGPKQIFLPFDQELSVKGYSNMLVATHNVISYAARKIKKEFFVPPAAEYNASSAHFLSALRRNVHIWDATSGEYVRKLIDVSPSADIVSACFALPFERRLILGTEDGKLLLVNYVTGAILDETQPHSAEVTQMAYCKATKMIISADYHGGVVITSEIQCKLKELQVLGFQHLDYVAAAVQSVGEPSTGLVFLDRYSIIALGDLTRVCLWHLDMETFKLTCFAKLSVPAGTLGLSLDVLNSIGVLRMEKSTATDSRSAESQPHDGDSAASREAEVAGEADGDKDRGNSADSDLAGKKRGDATKKDRIPENKPSVSSATSATSSGGAKTEGYDEGEVWIALGTERGRLACWALEDILESDATLMPGLKLRPVPDSLCPALRSSFNPYSLNVEPKKSSQAPPAFAAAATGVNVGRSRGSVSASVDASGVGVAESDRGGDGGVAASGATGGSGLIGDACFGDDDEDCSWRVPEASAPKAVWQGHSGAVSRIGSCSQPPCFFTLGEDGYQRTWSDKGKVLGQFALPNASETHHKRRQVLHMIVASTSPPLFRNIGWSFLVDTVRVRPLHEEMTAGLLDEVERRRAQKTSRRSTSSRGGSSFYKTVLDATSAAPTAAPLSPPAIPTPQTITFGERMASSGPPVAGRAASTPTAAGSHPSGATATSPARPGDCQENDRDALTAGRSKHGAADGAVPEPNPLAVTAQRRTEAAVAAKRQAEAERRQAALATIEKHRSHHRAASARSPAAAQTATAASSGVNQEGNDRLARDSNSVATTLTGRPVSSGDHLGAARAADRKGSLSRTAMTRAFSAQSVRSGATLGYYGRDEVNVLSAISKNPSRIAVYNRITEGKQGNNGGEKSPEIAVAPVRSPHRRRPRTTPSTMRLSSSTAALSLSGEDSSLIRLTSSSSNGERQRSATVISPPLSTAADDSRAESGEGVRPAAGLAHASGGKETPLGAMIGPCVGFGLNVGVVSEQPPPSRTVKMYRNAAREYGRGASAGQAMWM